MAPRSLIFILACWIQHAASCGLYDPAEVELFSIDAGDTTFYRYNVGSCLTNSGSSIAQIDNINSLSECLCAAMSNGFNSFSYVDGVCMAYSFWMPRGDLSVSTSPDNVVYVAEDEITSVGPLPGDDMVLVEYDTFPGSAFRGNVNGVDKIQWFVDGTLKSECDISSESDTSDVTCSCTGCPTHQNQFSSSVEIKFVLTGQSSADESYTITYWPVAYRNPESKSLVRVIPGQPIIRKSHETYPYVRSPNWYYRAWILYSPNTNYQQITIDFDPYFYVEAPDRSDSTRCPWEQLTIFDGATESDTQIIDMCGDTPPATITSTGDSLFVRTQIDGGPSGDGFQFTATTCIND